MEVVRSFCRICIANCGILVETDGERVVAVKGDPRHPVSRGYVCPKGRGLADAHHGDRRLASSLERREGRLVEVATDAGIASAALAVADIAARFGPESIGGFMGSGGFIDPAGSFVYRRLLAALGTKHTYSTGTVDSVAKTYVTALMAGTTGLIPHPDDKGTLLVFVGSNPVVSHGQSTMVPNPIERIRAAKSRGEVFVIDPRRSETARLADHHLAARPGSDHALLAHVVRSVLERPLDRERLADRAINLEALEAAVAGFDLHRTSTMTGLPTEAIERLVAAVHRSGRLAVVTGTGTTMGPHGNLVEWFAWALMILTGSFDQPGGMWFNPGYFTRVDRRDRLPRTRLDEPGPPSRPDTVRLMGEWPAALIPDEIEAGRLKALVVFGANAVTCLPDTPRVVAALASLEVLVVLDCDRTETAELATHVIACEDQLERPDIVALDMFAGQWYDQFTEAVVKPSPGRVPAWKAISGISTRLGHDVLGSGTDGATMTSVDVLRLVCRGGDLDALRAADGPLVEAEAIYGWAEPRLPYGRWDLAPAPLVAQLATSEPIPPMVLTPRRQLRHNNSQMYRAGDAAVALLHPADASELGISDADLVTITSATGQLTLPVQVTADTARGTVSVPHGWAELNVNRLVGTDSLDDRTGMPRMSGTPVSIRPAVPATLGPTASARHT